MCSSLFIDLRRNIIKADVGVAKKGQFPMALVENAHRFVDKKDFLFKNFFIFRKLTARSNKFPGIFASNSLNHTEPTNSHPNPVISFQDPTVQSYFK